MHESSPGYRPRRRFGQNFLVNPAAIDRIIAAFDPRPGDRVLEVGPGQGALTRRLAGRVAALTAVEIDRDLVAGLADLAERGVRVVQGDILAVDLAAILDPMGAGPGNPARLLANLPYNIATAVILRIIGARDRFRDLLVMVQREVAARILSPPGRKTYGGLSILCQTFAQCDGVLRLGPGSFRPRPRVDSEVVRLVLRPAEGRAAVDPAALSSLLRVCFAHRRKTLFNNLAALSLGDRPTRALIAAAGLDPALRPEAVPVEGYQALLSSWTAARAGGGV